MKKYTQPLLFALLTLAFGGCSKDHFDPKVDQYLSQERKDELKGEVESKVRLLEIELNGIYNNNVAVQTSGADSFGLKAIGLATDLSGLDMIQYTYSWFGTDYNFDMWRAEFGRTGFMWNFLYKQISSINMVLSDYFPEVPTNQVLYQQYAQLKALRGIYYYYLVNLYQHSYQGNATSLGVPLVLTPSDGYLARATVEAVYTQIKEDLSVVDNALFLITPSKTDVDKAVAATYLAKVYAHRQEWGQVLTYSRMVLNSGYFTFTSPTELQAGKWDLGTSSWLWGYDVTQENSTQWSSLYAHLDNTIALGYAGTGAFKNIYSNLYAQISNTDVRKQLYINRTLFPTIANRYRHLPDYANIKFVTDQNFLSDYCFLRFEDPFLLYTEALVELNQLDTARRTLSYFLQTFRDASYTSTAVTQDALRDEVRTQRRIELWGEGTSFFDFKRWGMGANRTEVGSNHVFAIQVPAGDRRWVYQIPTSEMEANTHMVQNQ